MKGIRKACVAVAAVCVVAVALPILNCVVPYNLMHRQLIEAAYLRVEIHNWQETGTFVGRPPRCMPYHTNLILNGTHYEIIVRNEAEWIRRYGYLLGAQDGTVIWVGKNGKMKVIRR
jgi:hypothetical protein